MSRISNLNTLKIGIFGNWYSSWYDKEYYSFLLFKDYKLIQYLNSIFYRLRLPTSHFYINRINQKYYYIESNIYITQNTFRRLTKSIRTYKEIFKYISLIEYLFDVVFLLPKDSVSEKNIDITSVNLNDYCYSLYFYLLNLNNLNINSNLFFNRFDYIYFMNYFITNVFFVKPSIKDGIQLNVFSNFLKVNDSSRIKFIDSQSDFSKKKLNKNNLSYFYLNSFFLNSNSINSYYYVFNVNYLNILKLLINFINNFIYNFIFTFYNIYIVFLLSVNTLGLDHFVYNSESFFIKGINFLLKVNTLFNYRLFIKSNIKLNYLSDFNSNSYNTLLDSKKTRRAYMVDSDTINSNYNSNKFYKYLNLLLNHDNSLFGLLYVQDFDSFSKKNINNTITIENDQVEAIYYKQINHFNNFFKRIFVYIYKKFFNLFHSSIELTISSFTGLQCFFLPTYYIKTFPIFDTKLLLDYISYNLKRRHHITKIFNKIALIQKRQNSDSSKALIGLYNEFNSMNSRLLNHDKYLSFFNLSAIYESLNIENIYNDQIKKKKNPISGIRIEFSGPPKKAERTAVVAYHDIVQDYRLTGKMPTHSVYADIHYYQSHIRLRRSTFGIKVWLFYYTRILNCNNVNKTIL